MLKDKAIFGVFLVAMMIILIGIIIFAALIPLNWYWLCGWAFGSLIATLSYLLNVLLITIFLHRVKTKSKGMILGYSRFFCQLALHTIGLITLIMINTIWKEHQIFKLKNLADLINPLNLFTYLGAIGIFTISSFFGALPIFNKPESEVVHG